MHNPECRRCSTAAAFPRTHPLCLAALYAGLLLAILLVSTLINAATHGKASASAAGETVGLELLHAFPVDGLYLEPALAVGLIEIAELNPAAVEPAASSSEQRVILWDEGYRPDAASRPVAQVNPGAKATAGSSGESQDDLRGVAPDRALPAGETP